MATRTLLPRRDLALLLLVVVTWGVNFAILDVGLGDFPPLLFAALRFALVGLCAVFVPRPKVRVRWILAVGTFTLLGQYSLLYLGLAAGMPSGLASLILQAQAMFTILFAAFALRERPGVRQLVGMAIGAGGLVLVGLAVGGSVTLLALLFLVGAAVSWAIGNVCTRFAKPDNGLRMIVWAALVPPLPLLALSLTTEGGARDAHALAHASLGSWISLAYTVGFSTIMAMGIYTALLSKYPTDRIVPFNLGIPVVGLATGWLLMNESVTAATLAGAAVVLVGLGLVVVKPRAGRAPVPAPATIDQVALDHS
jgi:O-acetylserine/cysteine efflux transporter